MATLPPDFFRDSACVTPTVTRYGCQHPKKLSSLTTRIHLKKRVPIYSSGLGKKGAQLSCQLFRLPAPVLIPRGRMI